MRLFFSSAWLLFLGLFLQVYADGKSLKSTKISVNQVAFGKDSFMIQLTPLVNDNQGRYEDMWKTFSSPFNVSVSAWVSWNDSNVLYSSGNGDTEKFNASKPFHLELKFTDTDKPSWGSRFNVDLQLNISSIEDGKSFQFNFTHLFSAKVTYESAETQAEEFEVFHVPLVRCSSGSITDLIFGLFADHELGFQVDAFISYVEMVFPSTVVGLRSGKEIKESAIIMYILAGLLSLPILYTIFRYIFFAVSTAIERRNAKK